MRRSPREAIESPTEQGQDEKVRYTFDFTGLGTTAPTSPTFALYDITDSTAWEDVSGSKLTDTGSVSGAIVTSKLVVELLPSHVYRLEAKADDTGGGRYEGYVIIYGAR